MVVRATRAQDQGLQCSGKQPSDGQPLSHDKVPDLDDYGLGCFPLAGSEIARLTSGP